MFCDPDLLFDLRQAPSPFSTSVSASVKWEVRLDLAQDTWSPRDRHPSLPLPPAQGPEPSLQHTLASSTFLIKMQHTLNSICMTGWVFSSRRSSLQSVPSGSCQGRGGISLSDADSSCPGAGWMEWKWHHVYSGKTFSDPDQCQQMLGCSRRENTPETSPWISSPGTHATPHSTHPPSALPQTHSTRHAPQTHPTPRKQISMYTTPPHEHPPHMPHTTRTPPPTHMSGKHINTCHDDNIHTGTTCSQIHQHPEACADARDDSSLSTHSRTSHYAQVGA